MRYNMQASNRVPLLVEWTCSNCGEQNAQVFMVENKVYASTKSSRKAENLKASLPQALKESSQEKITRIFQEAEEKCYRTAEFNCTCKKCSSLEAWSKLRYSKAQTIIVVLFLFIFLFLLVCFLSALEDGWDVELLIPMLCSLLPIIAWFIIKPIHRISMERQIKKLDPSSLPRISLIKIKTR